MKLSDVTTFDKFDTKIKKILAFEINKTNDMEESTQIDFITASIDEYKQLGKINDEEYNKIRVMLCDIALNYFK